MSLFTKANLFTCLLLLLAGHVLPVSAGRNDPPAGWNADEAAQRIERAWDVYNLPYGTLGMITHVIMLWTIACHLDGRSPLLPWRPLEFDRWNLGILGVTTIVSISLLAVNISAKDRSPGMTSLAVLHLVYSFVEDGIAAHLRNPSRRGKGLRWELTPWLLALMVASLINSQIMGTLDGILNGVTYFYKKTPVTNPTGLALNLCAIIGGVIALLTYPLSFCAGSANSRKLYRPYGAYIFAFFGLVSCLGFILAMDYTVGIVTGNAFGTPDGDALGLFWAYFVFQYVPVFTF
ncbi:hypothetical protein V8F33_011154 [Rhypophila sp. PSN 637]